jgi:hypothetical protein
MAALQPKSRKPDGGQRSSDLAKAEAGAGRQTDLLPSSNCSAASGTSAATYHETVDLVFEEAGTMSPCLTDSKFAPSY